MASPAPAPNQPGMIAGRFEIVRLLGDGGFARVYEAIDRELGRRVALKLFRRCARAELEAALREARAMARLNHEHVLAVHDIGEDRGAPFLAIEYAELDLRRWLTATPRSRADVLARFLEAGRGLEAAHRAGLVHHDFKPANVLVRANGTAAVGDFGLARQLDGDSVDEVGPGFALGTLRYIAPERLRGREGDERSDQFSYCVALWEALAGAHPFSGANPSARLDSIASGPTLPARTRAQARLPGHLVRALRRGMAYDPADRFEALGELLAALEQPRRSGPVRWLHRGARPTLTATLLIGVFVLGVGVAREAPALDVSVTPTAVLTSDAALSAAREAVIDGEPRRSVDLVMHAMPVIRETERAHQRGYLGQIEALGDLLVARGGYVEAATVYAAARKVAKDLQLDPTPYQNKRSLAQVRAVRMAALAATHGK